MATLQTHSITRALCLLLSLLVAQAAVSPLVSCGSARAWAFNIVQDSTAPRGTATANAVFPNSAGVIVARAATATENGFVELLRSNGSFTSVIGSPGTALTSFDASTGALSQPGAFTHDSTGSRLFFLDNSAVYYTTLVGSGATPSTALRYRADATGNTTVATPTSLYWDSFARRLLVSTTTATTGGGGLGPPAAPKASRVLAINDTVSGWSLFAGDANSVNANDNAVATTASIEPAFIVGVRGAGNSFTLYFSEPNKHRIRYVNSNGRVMTLAGMIDVEGWAGDGAAPSTATRFRLPGPLALYSNILYVRELGSVDIIRLVPVDGSGVVATLRLSKASLGAAALPVTSVLTAPSNPPGSPLSFNVNAATSYGLAYDSTRGWLLVTDNDAEAIIAVGCRPSCPAKKLCDALGNVVAGCPEHRYCAGDNFQELAAVMAPVCSEGTYCAENSSVPAQCERGFQCLLKERPASCPAGRWCAAGTGSNPPMCVAGVLCPAGTYAANGLPDGGLTPPGTFSDVPGRHLPAGSISPGYYGIAGATSIFGTAECPVGTWCGAGSGSPTKCSAGTWSNSTRRFNACDACPLGTFNPMEGSSNADDCRPCPEGLTTTTTGASSSASCVYVPYDCPPGTQPKVASPRRASDCAPLVCENGLRAAPSGKACTGCAPGYVQAPAGNGAQCLGCSALLASATTVADGIGGSDGAHCPGLVSRPLPPADKLVDRIRARATALAVASSSSASAISRAAGRQLASSVVDNCAAIASFQTSMRSAVAAAEAAAAKAGNNDDYVASIISVGAIAGIFVAAVVVVGLWSMRRADDESEAQYFEVLQRMMTTNTTSATATAAATTLSALADFASNSTRALTAMVAPGGNDKPAPALAADSSSGASGSDVVTTNPLGVAASSPLTRPVETEYRRSTKIRRLTRRLFLNLDVFDYKHYVPLFGWPRRVKTVLGGTCSALAVVSFLAVCCVLVVQRSFSNVLTAVALDGLGPFEYSSLQAAPPRADTAYTGLSGLNIIVTASGNDGACAVPQSWSFSNLYSGSYSLATTTCGSAFAQHVFSCQNCVLQSGSTLSLTLEWSCQSVLLQTFTVAASGDASMRNATASSQNMTTLPPVSAASEVSMLTSISWTLESLLGLQVDAINERRFRGLRLLQSPLVSSGATIDSNAFAPLQASVAITMNLSPLPLFSLTTLSERVTAAQLLSSLGGMLFIVSLFSFTFRHLEPQVMSLLPGSGAKVAILANHDIVAAPVKKGSKRIKKDGDNEGKDGLSGAASLRHRSSRGGGLATSGSNLPAPISPSMLAVEEAGEPAQDATARDAPSNSKSAFSFGNIGSSYGKVAPAPEGSATVNVGP